MKKGKSFRNKLCLSFLSFLFAFSSLSYAVDSIATDSSFSWDIQTINADSKFEAAGIGDINQDGKADIICGGFWYEAPDWKSHKIAELEEISEYYNDFANLMQDVDRDGDLDIVNCTWFSQQVFWRENPGVKANKDLWLVHVIEEPGNVETGLLFDLNNDGVDDLIPNLMSEVAWYEKVQDKPEWIKHVVGKEGAGHGLGYGDLNADGVSDLITPKGWYEGKKEGNSLGWTWHPDFDLGSTSVPIIVYDVNEDKVPDVVWGLGHDYGLFWLEQMAKDDTREWVKHEIEHSWSQPHYLALVDLNKDGKLEFATGKRYRAHNGHDPGETDPLCVYVYSFDPKTETWKRNVVSEGDKVGFGLNPAVGDIDGDGDLDLVCPGKSGLYLAKQK